MTPVIKNLFHLTHSGSAAETLALIRQSLKSHSMDREGTHFDENFPHVFMVFGASVSISKPCVSIRLIYVINNDVFFLIFSG